MHLDGTNRATERALGRSEELFIIDCGSRDKEAQKTVTDECILIKLNNWSNVADRPWIFFLLVTAYDIDDASDKY
jgi:hypothetical protein